MKKTSFENVCTNSLRARGSCKEGENSINTLFEFKEERFVFTKFQRLDTSRLNEISVMSVVRLDNVKTDVADSSWQTIEQFLSRLRTNLIMAQKLDLSSTVTRKRLPNEELLKVKPYHKVLQSEFKVCYRLLLCNFLNMQLTVCRPKIVRTTAHSMSFHELLQETHHSKDYSERCSPHNGSRQHML